MTVTEDRKLVAQSVVKAAKVAKFDLVPYVKAPNGSAAATLGVPDNGSCVRFWPGNASFKCFPDPTERQMILWMDEEAHELETFVPCNHPNRVLWRKVGKHYEPFVNSSALIVQQARRNWLPWVPKGTRWRFELDYDETAERTSRTAWGRQVGCGPDSAKLFKKEGDHYIADGWWPLGGKLRATAKVPKQSQSFLVGVDESSHFVSMLPERVDSVVRGHELLRPKGLKTKVVRQGEWFFEPISKKLTEMLNELAVRRADKLDHQPLEEGSTHIATTLRYRGELYATGVVADSRRFRHAPLFLPQWHRVVRNTEVEPPMNRRRRWD